MAEASQIKCPNCGQTYFVQPEQWAQYAGQTINCTRCGREFTVTGATQMPISPTPPPIPQQVRPMQPAPMNVGPTSPFAPQPPAIGYSGAPVPTSGWAIASLVCGIVGFCVPLICGIFAVIAGFLGLSQIKQGRATGRGLAISGIILGFISLFLNVIWILALFLPALNAARHAANQVKCANNMRQIGLAMIMYANSHQNEFPGDFTDLVRDPSAPSTHTFVCPEDSKSPPSSASAQQTITDLNSGNHCSYIYVAKGSKMSALSDAGTVLMYEDPALQRNNEINVAFADGHVEKVSVSTVQSAVQSAAGKGPVVITSTGQ